MIKIQYAPSFIRQYKKLEKDLKEEIKDKIEEFQEKSNHKRLNVHKLHGELKDFYSFKVNYKIRIVFYWIKKDLAWLEAIGNHNIYK